MGSLSQKVKIDFPPDFIWASTLKRARETAEILEKLLDAQCNWKKN